MSKILVTGGAGYIGSHTCVELIDAGHELLVIDNLSNSSIESLSRVEQITGKPVTFEQIDIRDARALNQLFDSHTFDAVIHFAGLKAVGESCELPLEYYHNNVSGTLNLCLTMKAHNCRNLVFSSSATVYGDPASLPIAENFPLSATNPYGRSKLIIEEMLGDLHRADSAWNILLLRYFNPAGAHPSGLIGEDPNGVPNNLLPYISQVAIGKLEQLRVFGGDYDTLDGTGVRDYIHVVDLAKGHLKALQKLQQQPGCKAYNLGVGNGYSVLQMVQAYANASGKKIPYQIVDRRPGDIASCYADASLAAQELGWSAELGLDEMVRDGWNWQQKNPDGFG
ncbi:UDP-glucose 4-epimerase GalE [Aestuariirhabdus sp. LZHN29]|uniref:UDP-glucose 4-epimerase GalE n=1 Tax=Aestuariirhabdus sp. LZHN29 TaxID=3417462 RepID=UPI003CE8662B